MADILSRLAPAPGAKKRRTRVGRGPGSGLGKTCGKGQKGQRSRSGRDIGRGFEGGQMPLARRLPKRGFVNVNRVPAAVVSVAKLDKHFDGGEVTVDALKAKGLVPKRAQKVKILGNGEISKALTVRVHAFSESARKKIEAAGGKAEVVSRAG